MFSGIVESTQELIKFEKIQESLRIWLQRPEQFNDLKAGDSICVNGVCLTVEVFDAQSIQFTMGKETLYILGDLEKSFLAGHSFNLERSLRFGDRIHGHLVSGHAHSMGLVKHSQNTGVGWDLRVEVSKSVLKYIWPKSGITLNGVSLTVNSIDNNMVSVHLIPETVERTNLSQFLEGEHLCVEPDYLAVGWMEIKSRE